MRTPAGFEIPVEATCAGPEDPLSHASFRKRLLYHIRTERAPFRWLLSRLLYRTGAGSLISFSRGLYRLRFFPTSMTLSAWDDPEAWRDDEMFLRRVLREGDVVVDVGANVGFVALPAAALVGATGAVIAIEPHPKIFSYLERNVRFNGFQQVQLFNVAIGNTDGQVHFSSIPLHDNNNRVIDRGLTVRMTTLDKLLRGQDAPIRLLKVDVEGFEKFVFEGAEATLARTEMIYFEVAEYNFRSNGYTTTDLLQFVATHGFDLYMLSSSGQECPISTSFTANGWTNLLARRKQ